MLSLVAHVQHHQSLSSGYVEPGGTQIRVGSTTSGADAYSSAALVNAFYDAAAAMDEKGVSQDGRVGVLTPVSTMH